MKDTDLRWKISSMLAGTPNYEIVDLLFSAIPRNHLEEMLRRNKPKAEYQVDSPTAGVWIDRSRT